VPKETRRLQFSFRHLEKNHPKFKIGDCQERYLRELISRLSDYSKLTVDEFVDQDNQEHRHQIDFPDTSEKNGFISAPDVDMDQLAYAQAWQFQVCDKTDWRAHGFLLGDTFFIVWLDPSHRLYPRAVDGAGDC
jgi:hypothetical protein